jgi:hypothetical protein
MHIIKSWFYIIEQESSLSHLNLGKMISKFNFTSETAHGPNFIAANQRARKMVTTSQSTSDDIKV